MDKLFLNQILHGGTIVAASGDLGASGFTPFFGAPVPMAGYPASSPFALSVGGTMGTYIRPASGTTATTAASRPGTRSCRPAREQVRGAVHRASSIARRFWQLRHDRQLDARSA